ncbi:IS110 family RNA-guided transposase [Acetobacter cibinongensis]|uniref:Transposase n=1 Tax=Acetobacter cibinongensis TaxID=146475 RepID=A0A1Z5YSJ2_9PROT|nr:IS110 family transposase [Acetobacter cibinongensis]OUJ01122.1 transposase [Acetobacter cibinongensis]
MKDTMIGVDLAKNVFQVHVASLTGEVRFRKKVRYPQFLQFMASQPPTLVVLEACGSAHYWARELMNAGHEVKLITSQYVSPFVKGQKNDAGDAEAIVIAAQQPEMRFVAPKTEAQQARAVLFRCRDRLVHQRTELINALRGTLYEFGVVVPKGIAHLKRIEEFVADDSVSLPAVVRKECRDLLEQIDEQSARITEKTHAMDGLSKESGMVQLLETMPGIGPLTALAVEAFAPSMKSFRSGRDFSAWLCLVLRQFSSDGKERLGRVSKAGQADIRRLLIIGAMTRVNSASRKPRMLVAIALANKMARTIWAMLTKQENYRDTVLSAAA